MNYDDYIDSDSWSAKRRTRLDFARQRCELCNRPDRLEVHHRTYERLGSEDIEDLLALCERCHGVFHSRLALHSAAPAPAGAPLRVGISEEILESIQTWEAVHGREGELTGVPSGFTVLDGMTGGWQPGTLNVIAGRPGMGTTSFLLGCARNAALHPRRPASVLYLTTEMGPEQLSQRLIASEALVDLRQARTGRLHDDDWPKLARAAGRLSAASLTIESLARESAHVLASEIHARRRQHGADLVIVDSVSDLLVEGMDGRWRGDQIAEIASVFKSLALQLGIPLLVSAPVSSKVDRQGGDKRPTASDIEHGDGLVHRADTVLLIYRAERYGITVDEAGRSTEGIGELLIGKQRNGPIGDVKVAFVNQFARFENLTTYLAGDTDGAYEYGGPPGADPYGPPPTGGYLGDGGGYDDGPPPLPGPPTDAPF